MPKQLVVFDFDWSLVDNDTDRYVFEVLDIDIRRDMRTRKDDVQWTDLVAESLKKLHEKGGTREQIEGALKNLPFHPAMQRGIKAFKARTDFENSFLCLSNANSVFISTILKDKNLEGFFDEIITNPAEWDPSGLLKVRRRVDPKGLQHQCKVGCSPNMCKGDELHAFLERYGVKFDRVIYIGDGSNDYCPVVRLKEQDLVLCRRFKGLEKRIAQEGNIRCGVKYWGGAWEVEEIFGKL